MSPFDPAIERLFSAPLPFCVIASIQSVLALPRRAVFSGAYCATAALNCVAFSMSGFFTIFDVDPQTAQAWGQALIDWARVQPAGATLREP